MVLDPRQHSLHQRYVVKSIAVELWIYSKHNVSFNEWTPIAHFLLITSVLDEQILKFLENQG